MNPQRDVYKRQVIDQGSGDLAKGAADDHADGHVPVSYTHLESAPETPKCYHNCELCVIRNGKGKRPEGYVEPPLEQLAQLRRKVEDAPEEKREFSGEGSSPVSYTHLSAGAGHVSPAGSLFPQPGLAAGGL